MGTPDLDFDPATFIRSSWGLFDVHQEIGALAASLVDRLAEQRGTVGDDDAGSAFGRLYDDAADGTLDAISHATNLVGAASGAAFRAAVTFMARDAELAAQLRDQGVLRGDGALDDRRAPRCADSPLGLASRLPNVRGTTTTADRWVWGTRFRGSPDGLRAVAATWREAARITTRVLQDVQGCWALVRPARGKTADATHRLLLRLCGDEPCLARVDAQGPLLANVPAACGQLARACDDYADNITAARCRVPERILAEPFTGPLRTLLDAPALGGNGEDGGLYDANATTHSVLALAGVAPALDRSRARVPVPRPGEDAHWWDSLRLPLPLPGTAGPRAPGPPGVPEIPLLSDVPVLAAFVVAPAAYRPPDRLVVRRPPLPAPTPPEPGFPPLTPAQRRSFEAWAAELQQSGFGGGTKLNAPANVYQYQVSGYPERVIRCGDGEGNGTRIAADGLRADDGMAVEAKYVKKPNQCSTPRSLDRYMDPRPWELAIHRDDEDELDRYRAAMTLPGNDGHLRGVEICTNDRDAVDYFDALMVSRRVRGYARYVPLSPNAAIPTMPAPGVTKP